MRTCLPSAICTIQLNSGNEHLFSTSWMQVTDRSLTPQPARHSTLLVEAKVKIPPTIVFCMFSFIFLYFFLSLPHQGPHSQEPRLIQCSSVLIWKFFIIFEHRTLCFHFAPGPAYYVGALGGGSILDAYPGALAAGGDWKWGSTQVPGALACRPPQSWPEPLKALRPLCGLWKNLCRHQRCLQQTAVRRCLVLIKCPEPFINLHRQTQKPLALKPACHGSPSCRPFRATCSSCWKPGGPGLGAVDPEAGGWPGSPNPVTRLPQSMTSYHLWCEGFPALLSPLPAGFRGCGLPGTISKHLRGPHSHSTVPCLGLCL